MIEKLDHKNEAVARLLHALFQASYRIEAKLLKATVFPPLNRTLDEYVHSDTEFFGVSRADKLVAAVEVRKLDKLIHIQSLVVQPEYFRQGLGRQLMRFVLDNFETEAFIVETGVDNKPATNLYLQIGFEEQEQWDTEVGIRKVRFKKS